MENYKLVLPEHLNHYGYLFGGHLLKWVDEVAWIAASLDYPGCNFVTIGMDKVEFRKSVKQGALLRLEVNRAREGNTSVQYTVPGEKMQALQVIRLNTGRKSLSGSVW
jgi:acyl-CoA hydrolase